MLLIAAFFDDSRDYLIRLLTVVMTERIWSK